MTGPRMRVCLVLGTATGGMGAHVRRLSARLAERGDEVSVVGPRATEELFDFSDIGAKFVRVEISASPKLADTQRVSEIRRAVAGADIVHAHGLRAGFLAALALTRRPTPLVVTLHNAVLATGTRRLVFGGVERVVAKRATVSLCVSSDLVRRMSALGADDVRLAPVGADLIAPPHRPMTDLRAAIGLNRGQAMVLAVARLAHQKGLDVLLAAAPAWRARVDHPLLVVAGDGPDQKDLHEQAARLAIDVRFLGRRNDIADLMRSADVVVLPSRWEGSPLTAHEALQSGTPLVATSVGGVPDLVQAPDGPAALLVPAEDPSELAAGVARVLDDPDLRNELINRGVQRAKAWPTSQQTITKVLAVYSELLGAAE